MIHEWKITETADGYLLEERDNRGNIWPPTHKATKRAVAARLIQVMGIGPVAPQIGPEDVYLGSVVLSGDLGESEEWGDSGMEDVR